MTQQRPGDRRCLAVWRRLRAAARDRYDAPLAEIATLGPAAPACVRRLYEAGLVDVYGGGDEWWARGEVAALHSEDPAAVLRAGRRPWWR